MDLARRSRNQSGQWLARQRQERQDAGDSTTAHASAAKERESPVAPGNLGPGGASAPVGCKLTPAGLRLCEGVGGPVALGSAAHMLLTLGTLALAALRGCMLPWLSTGVHGGALAHHGCAGPGDAPRPSPGSEVGIKRRP